jgi:hypothetical protein
LAKLQFPLAIDFCPSVSHVPVARALSRHDQVVRHYGGAVVEFDYYEAVRPHVRGHSSSRGFYDLAFIVKITIPLNALKVIRNSGVDSGCVLTEAGIEELLLPVNQLPIEGRGWLGSRRLSQRLDEAHQNRSRDWQNRSHNRLQNQIYFAPLLPTNYNRQPWKQ